MTEAREPASGNAQEALEAIAAEVRTCPKCDLCETRTKAVPGTGPSDARIFFIGEGPGWHEDQQGLPFVGNAGKYLDSLLGIAGLKRVDVFITNVVKCRPPGNRDPLPDEIAACSEYLERQPTAVDPAVVVTLGRFSMARWFPGAKISRIHGQEKQFGRLTVVPMYHPAAALRTNAVKLEIEADFARLPAIIEAAERNRAKAPAQEAVEIPPIDQLKLF